MSTDHGAPSGAGPRRARFLPVASWAPAYRAAWLRSDAIAGCTIWGLLIPEGIAYASLAGLPPQAGLYTLLASLVLYAAFGTSRQLVVAGTSASAVLVYSSVSALHPGSAAAYASLAAGLIILTGILFLCSGLFRLGFITQFLSRPVMAGFVFGLAVFVAVGQLPKLLGLAKGPGDTISQFARLVARLGDASWVTFAVGAVALALLFALDRLKGVPGGSLSQSAVNDGAGARSQLSPVIAAALSLVTVLALTPLFTQLPEAVLAAMIIHAVSHLMRVAEMRRYYRLVRREFWLGMITLLGVITLDVLPGLVIGVVLSLLVLAYLASRPVFSVLGASRDVPGAYEDVRRHASARPDAPLFYANAKPLRDAVRGLRAASAVPVRALILDLDASDELDVTSAEALSAIAADMATAGVRFGLAHLHDRAARLLRRSGAVGDGSACRVFPTLDSAVRWARPGQPAERLGRAGALTPAARRRPGRARRSGSPGARWRCPPPRPGARPAGSAGSSSGRTGGSRP
jgi:MFS superfamily sulfate permease-like transporter